MCSRHNAQSLDGKNHNNAQSPDGKHPLLAIVEAPGLIKTPNH
jgi:hypothetical protein